MRPVLVFLLASAALLAQQSNPATEAGLRRALLAKTGTVTLPAGTIEISRELVIPADAHDLDIRGSGTTIKAATAFRGRALIVLSAGKTIKIHDLSLDGTREALAQPAVSPPAGAMLSRVVANNGILSEGVTDLEIAQVKATEVAGFPILINGGSKVRIHDIEITASGSVDSSGHNNGTGGVVIEEGATDFEILRALIGKVRGNGIWIRSTGNANVTDGRIADSEFAILARAAIELNHASNVTIENNNGHMIGFPGEEVLAGATLLPAIITSTGNVDHSVLRGNNFEQVAGRCFALDGFNNGEVTGNSCSAVLFNALLIRGSRNQITHNRFTDLNSARRDQPESLRAGIYLAGGSTGNTIDANDIDGYGMARHCIGGPTLDTNKIAKNSCSDGLSVGWLRSEIPR
jgi:hypothetical protein